MATKRTSNRKTPLEFTVSRVHEFEESGNVAFELHVGRVTIYNMAVIRHAKGDFISFPSRKVPGKKRGEDKYYNYAYISLSDDEQAAIIEAVEAELDDFDE